jgi:hypothetical protein
MPVVRMEGLRALERKITAKVPALEGRVRIGFAPPGTIQVWPTLTIAPAGKWRHVVYDAAVPVRNLPGQRVVLDCGHHEVTVQLVVATTSYEERAELAEQILRVFRLDNELRPNVLVCPVTACVDLGDTFATFALDDEEWDDEQAFERTFEAIIATTGTFPALAVDNVPTIDQLVLGLGIAPAEGFPTTLDAPSVELVVINEDGTISPAP